MHYLHLRTMRLATRLLAWLLLAVTGREVFAQEMGFQISSIVRMTAETELDAVGNANSRFEMTMPREAYRLIKRQVSPEYTVVENGQQVVKSKAPKVEDALRYLGFMSFVNESLDIKGEFDDEAAMIHASFRDLGRASFRQGHWSYSIGNSKLHKSVIKGEQVELELREINGPVIGITRHKLRLPAGATHVEFLEKSGELVYDAPIAKLEEGKTAQNRPEMKLDSKPQLMSALYKLYGNPSIAEMWAARSIFQNDTSEVLSDFRTRLRIEETSSWTPWLRKDRVFPGQTVVSAYYPIIDGKIANLKSTAQANVQLEYEYTRPNGEKVTDAESGQTKLLGMNDALWSNIQLSDNSTWFTNFRSSPTVLTSFTSATDPVILDIVGVVSAAAGGQANSLDDASALRFMGTLYNLFRQNISYETTAGGVQESLLHQYLKYGRDVVRTRSGTCVNLAILYASACEAVGLKPYIILIPGHAFAAVKLPQSGEMVFVETTGCGGGTKATSRTFLEARESALRTYQQSAADGRLMEIDILAIRQNGVTSPELPDLGTNPLKQWNILPPDAIDQVHLPKLLMKVKTSLDAANFQHVPVAGLPAVAINFQTQTGNRWGTVIQAFEDREIIVFNSLLPEIVPANLRQAAYGMLAELNAVIHHGNFQLSEKGEVAYRTSTNVKGGQLTPSMVQNELELHQKLMEKMAPELRKHILGSQTPAK